MRARYVLTAGADMLSNVFIFKLKYICNIYKRNFMVLVNNYSRLLVWIEQFKTEEVLTKRTLSCGKKRKVHGSKLILKLMEKL